VGSVFDHSNAAVARLLGCKVIIISSGGIGRPVDEIMLNKALFEREGVKVLGAIVNKVLPEKFEKINRLVRKGLERKGVKVLGVIPYNPMLSRPSIEQILEETDYEVLCGKEHLENSVSQVIVGAMEPHDAVKFIAEDSLMITPGDREDMIMTSLGCFRQQEEKRLKISGIILTGAIKPEAPIMELLSRAQVPVLMAKEDTYDVATCIHDLTVKIRPVDKEKIDAVVKLVKYNVDLDRILKGM
jgi:BioD-like phosphotransacetylase family protein